MCSTLLNSKYKKSLPNVHPYHSPSCFLLIVILSNNADTRSLSLVIELVWVSFRRYTWGLFLTSIFLYYCFTIRISPASRKNLSFYPRLTLKARVPSSPRPNVTPRKTLNGILNRDRRLWWRGSSPVSSVSVSVSSSLEVNIGSSGFLWFLKYKFL